MKLKWRVWSLFLILSIFILMGSGSIAFAQALRQPHENPQEVQPPAQPPPTHTPEILPQDPDHTLHLMQNCWASFIGCLNDAYFNYLECIGQTPEMGSELLECKDEWGEDQGRCARIFLVCIEDNPSPPPNPTTPFQHPWPINWEEFDRF